MRCLSLVVAAGLSVAVASGRAQDETKPAPPKANEVEVKFGDNSTVRMLMLQENLEVVTKFGKLLVPMSDVRKITLGVHLADGVADKISAAMKKLSSENFKERDEAVNQLVAVGPGAYPTLYAAAKSPDQEVSQRAQMALKRLKAKHPANQLRLTVNDRIVTHDFTMVGRIVSPTIKAQTPYFGMVDLKLNELASILWLNANTELEVTVDAGKYAHQFAWMDSGVNLEMGSGLVIQAAGDIDLLPGNGNQFVSGPQGNANFGGRGGPGNRPPGMLVGKIGQNGTMFTIGERYQGIPNQEGRLYLQIIPGNFGGNQPATGAYKVTITTGLDIR